jgi:hypothetical protein
MAKQLITGQYYNSRLFEGPRALEAAKDFAKLAGEQVDMVFSATGREEFASVDLDEWPNEEMFEGWFSDWSERWSIEVHD